MMVRNLDNRVEVAAPIYDEEIRKEIKSFFDMQFRDVMKARVIKAEQDNQYRTGRKKSGIRAQEDLYDHILQTQQ